MSGSERIVARPRRLRSSAALREAVAETHVTPSSLVQPHFVVAGTGTRQPIESMPGIDRVSADVLVEDVGRDRELGIRLHLLFGVVEEKDASGRLASEPDGPVPTALRALRREFGGELELWADVCLCGYTDHGHCGKVQEGKILNDETLPELARAAAEYARSGASFVAPSDMMDGRVGFLRQGLDEAGHTEVGILAYSAKMASSYYGPFREAADSSPAFGDRRTYQMDPANAGEALREIELDLEEGADIVMVKPALAYLDVVRRVADAFEVPVAAYNVSGEYSMIKAAVARGLLDERHVVLETLGSMKRAGADILLTYHGKDVAKWLA
ncbi:MAG TPA: porphobilinogen synthase [bacterium]|nr:porphobilinogen synthase [bacterium]